MRALGPSSTSKNRSLIGSLGNEFTYDQVCTQLQKLRFFENNVMIKNNTSKDRPAGDEKFTNRHAFLIAGCGRLK